MLSYDHTYTGDPINDGKSHGKKEVNYFHVFRNNEFITQKDMFVLTTLAASPPSYSQHVSVLWLAASLTAAQSIHFDCSYRRNISMRRVGDSLQDYGAKEARQ